MQLIPLHDQILLKPAEAAEKIGRILVPETSQVPANQGVIIEFGKNCPKEPLLVGDTVFFPLNAQHIINVDGTKFYLVRHCDCIGYLRKSPDIKEVLATTKKKD